MKYIKTFFRTRNFTLTCTELWSVIIFVENVLGCCRRYWRSASYLPVIVSAARTVQNISKERIHGECLLIFLDTRSNITLWYGTNFFIIWQNYKWEDCEIHETWHNYQHYTPGISDLQVPIILISILPLVHLLWNHPWPIPIPFHCPGACREMKMFRPLEATIQRFVTVHSRVRLANFRVPVHF